MSAAAVQGAMLASFSASVGILLGRHHYTLSSAHYSQVFLPQVITAIAAALIAAESARGISRGRALRLGLGLSVVGVLLLVTALALGDRSPSLVLILIASALAGGGFGLSYPALIAFALDAVPNHAERSILAVNLMLAAGLAVAPGLEVAAERFQAWWALEVVLCALALAIMMAAGRSCVGPDASRRCNLHLPRRQPSAWHKIFPVLALLAGACAIMLAAWAQINHAGLAAHPGFSLLLVASFWAAAVTAARVAFAAIERRQTWKRSTTLVPFVLAAAVLLIGFAIGQSATATVGIFVLAAVVAAAFMPLPANPGAEMFMLWSLLSTAGVIALYPAVIGMAGPTFGGLERRGAPVLMIFVVTGVIGVVASLLAAGLPVWERAAQARSGPGPQFHGATAVPVGAVVRPRESERPSADRTGEAARRPKHGISRSRR
jgi:hypothetical protein